MRCLFIVIGLTTGVSAFGQISPEKLLATTEQAKWTKAETTIRKALSKDTISPEPPYLLALYYFHKTQPTYNLDSARIYAKRSSSRYGLATARERDKLRKIPLDSFHLRRLKIRIDSAAFAGAKKQNTTGAYQYFIDTYSTASQRKAAIELRDEVAYAAALKSNTWTGFQEFMKKYPSSHRRKDAQARFDKLLFEDKTRDQRLASFMKFYAQYPSSPFRGVAEKNIFEIATAPGLPQSFLFYINHYPESRLTRVARNMLFEIRMADSDEIPKGSWMTDSLRKAAMAASSYWVPIVKGGQFGFMDESGTEVVAPQFESLEADYKCGDIRERFVVTSKGLLARNGKIFWRGRVTEVKDLRLGFFLITSDSGKQVIHESGFRIGPQTVDDAQVVGDWFVATQKSKKWTLHTLVGKPLLSTTYDAISVMDSIILLQRSGKKIVTTPSRIARTGDNIEMKEDFVVDECRKWVEQNYWVRNGVLEGVIDGRLNFVIPFDRQTLKKTSFGYVTGKGDRLFVQGIKSLEGKPYKTIQEQGNWVKIKTPSGLHLLHDRGSGSTLEGDSVWFQGQLAFLESSDSVKAILPTGQKIPFQKNSGFQFKEYKDSAAWIVLDDKKKKTVIDAVSGAKLFSLEVDQFEPASTHLFIVTWLGRKGLINKEGKLLLPPEFDAIVATDVNSFSLLKDKKFGWYDAKNNILIKPLFDRNVLPYNSRYKLAFKEKGYGFLFSDGRPLGINEWEEIQFWTDSVAWVKKGMLWKLLEIHSQKIKLDRIRKFNMVNDSKPDKVCVVQQDNSFGVISSRRGTIIPIQYSDIVNLGSREVPLYFTEKHVEEAGISVIVYYDRKGKIIRKQALEAEEFEKIYCDN